MSLVDMLAACSPAPRRLPWGAQRVAQAGKPMPGRPLWIDGYEPAVALYPSPWKNAMRLALGPLLYYSWRGSVLDRREVARAAQIREMHR